MNLLWRAEAWEEYTSWQRDDVKMCRKINALVRDLQRGDEGGLGKPEILRGDLTGWISRRIDREHRLVYRVVKDTVEILQCRYHYGR